MKEGKNKILLILGIVDITYWLLDFFNNAVIPNNYSWLLWYSAAGMLLTGIALVIQNVKLIWSLFCALFVLETLWIVDSLYLIFTHRALIGFSEYMLAPTFHTKEVLFTLYHVLIPISLLAAVLIIKKTYKYGWIGATIFAIVLSLLTYFIAGPESQVNCLNGVKGCKSIFPFLYQINNPYRIMIVLVSLMILIYIPTNYILYIFKKDRKRGHVIETTRGFTSFL